MILLWRRPRQKTFLIVNCRGHQRGARGHQVARKDQVGPRACSKNNITMINIFTLTNINNKILEGKLKKIFISEVCIKVVTLRINRYTTSNSQFQKGWWPLVYCALSLFSLTWFDDCSFLFLNTHFNNDTIREASHILSCDGFNAFDSFAVGKSNKHANRDATSCNHLGRFTWRELLVCARFLQPWSQRPLHICVVVGLVFRKLLTLDATV